MSLQHANLQMGQPCCPVTPTFVFQDQKLQRITVEDSPSSSFHIKGKAPDLEPLEAWFSAYSNGVHLPFPFSLDFGDKPFSRQVLEALQTIDFGEVMTYGQLAQKLGKPGAARAVGNACNKNPYPLVVPCHRVIRSGGKTGGFALGCEMKENLLRFERLSHSTERGSSIINS